MTVRGYEFGHQVEYVYSDTKEPVGEKARRCPKCNQYRNDDGTDPCWGRLPGVQSACCGHGKQPPFVMLENGNCLYGGEAEEYAGRFFKFVTDMNMYADRGLVF